MPSAMAENSSTSATKKHITSACTCCRRRKVKCDGKDPSCSNCILYKQSCKYTYAEDKRKLSSKKTIRALSERIKLLEDLLRTNGIEVPPDTLSAGGSPIPDSGITHTSPASEENHGQKKASDSRSQEEAQMSALGTTSEWIPQLDNFQSDYSDTGDREQPSQTSGPAFLVLNQNGVADGESTFSIRSNRQNAQPAQQGALRGRTLTEYGDPNDYSTTAVAGDDDHIHHVTNGNMDPPDSSFPYLHGTSRRRQSSIDWHNDNSWSKEHDEFQVAAIESANRSDDDIMDQLSARMGSFQIAEDGQLRYFGATSNLHILHNGMFFLSRSPIRSIRTEGNDVLVRAGLGQMVSTETERHLAELYFKWEDPAIHVVDEEMYYAEQARWRSGEDGSPFYSETLKNAICAIGASLSARTNLGVPEPAAEFFNLRAKALLEIEMDSPTVATVQALVIMSASEAAFTRDARGWLYSGMAVRLSADLGLHLDLSNHVREGNLTARELDVRRTAFWGVFIHDNMWSLYVGRPWGINIRDISISRPPIEQDEIAKRSWEYCPTAENGSGLGYATRYIHDPVEAYGDSNISLGEMMRRLSRTLYAGRRLSNQELCDFAEEMRQELSKWQDNLRPELKVDLADEGTIYLPHVLQLHMQLYAISIFLHRPFFSRNIELDEVGIRVFNQARRVCLSAARSLVDFVRLYRKQHTLRRTNVQIVHLLFTASLIHIYNTCTSTGEEAQKALSDLQFCCQALTEIGLAYKNSTRALEVLICIKREWQSKVYAKRLKRTGSTISLCKERKKRSTTDKDGSNHRMLGPPDGPRERPHQQLSDEAFSFPSSSVDDLGMDSAFSSAFPLGSGYADSLFALGYLNTLPGDVDISEEGLNSRNSVP